MDSDSRDFAEKKANEALAMMLSQIKYGEPGPISHDLREILMKSVELTQRIVARVDANVKAADGAAIGEDDVEDPTTPDFTSEDMKNMVELTRSLSKSLAKSSSSGESSKLGLGEITNSDETNMNSFEAKTTDPSANLDAGEFTANVTRAF